MSQWLQLYVIDTIFVGILYPNIKTIRRLMQKFEQICDLKDFPRSSSGRTVGGVFVKV